VALRIWWFWVVGRFCVCVGFCSFFSFCGWFCKRIVCSVFFVVGLGLSVLGLLLLLLLLLLQGKGLRAGLLS
jgi:hypothetical protein